MENLREIRLPDMPECWQDCGVCAAGELRVHDIRVEPGDRVRRCDPLLVIETEKTTLEIPAPAAGLIVALCVGPDEPIDADSVLFTLLPDG